MIKVLAKKIIKKYENSKAFGEPNYNKRLSINFKTFKEYEDYKTPEYKQEINDMLIKWEKEGLVEVVWVVKKQAAKKIFFHPSDIGAFYDVANKKPKLDKIEKLAKILEDSRGVLSVPWMIEFIDDQLERINKTKSPYSILINNNIIDIITLLREVERLIKGDIFVLERVLSKRCYNDSKRFEKQYRGVLLSIIKKYAPIPAEGMSDIELLEEYNIEKTTTSLFLKGPVILKVNGEAVDISSFGEGIGLLSSSLSDIKIHSIPEWTKVYSVENKANYISMARDSKHKNDLIIFNGGFYNKKQRTFLKQLNNKKVLIKHTGDLDYGGFMIFNQVKSFIPSVEPYKMDVETFNKYKEFGEEITNKRTIENIEKLLANSDYFTFRDVLKQMLYDRKTLEQESYLIV